MRPRELLLPIVLRGVGAVLLVLGALALAAAYLLPAR